MGRFGLTQTLGNVGDILGRTGKKSSPAAAGGQAGAEEQDHGRSAGYDPITGKETEMLEGAPVPAEKFPQKECDFTGLMLGNQTGRWSPLKHDIRWAFDHSLHGKQVHVWWPGKASKGECNDLSDKGRGCWFRAKLLSDPDCLFNNRCLHVAMHDGEPVHTFTCPKWIKDDEGAVCKLPLSWQACPPKFHVARVDTGIPQFLKEAKKQACELNEGEQLFVGKWSEPHSTVLYTVRKTDMAQLEVVVEPHGHEPAPPAIPGFPVPEEPPPPTESQVLRRGQPRSEDVPGFGLGAVLRKALGGLGKKDKDEKLKGILLLEGEWMRAKLMNEFDKATGAEVKMQIDENGSLKVSYKKGAHDKWHEPVVAMRNIRTKGGTGRGADMLGNRTDMLGNWGYCEEHGGRKQPPVIGTHGGSFEGAGPNCRFPFEHNDTVYKSCKVIGDLAEDGLVCQTDSEGSWGYCNCKVKTESGGVVKTHGGDAKGAKCKFPFTFEGVRYNRCKDFGDGAPACITDDEGHWGYCNCKKPVHFLGPGGTEEEEGFTGHEKTAKGPRHSHEHCIGTTAGKTNINMIFDIRHNQWYRCTEKFRCEPFSIRDISNGGGQCGRHLHCKHDELCFNHRVTSKRSTFECVSDRRVYVLPDGDDAAKYSSPWQLAILTPPVARTKRFERARERVGHFL